MSPSGAAALLRRSVGRQVQRVRQLPGAETQRVITRDHSSLSVYGIGKALGLNEWRDIARALLHQGLVTQSQDGYAVLSMNESSWQVLRAVATA